MAWKPFGSAAGTLPLLKTPEGYVRQPDYNDRTEIACALMLGARFEKTSDTWCCSDDTEESSRDQTGAWNFKVNAARAYLSTKGVFFDKQGNPIDRSIMRSPATDRKGDQHGRGR